MEEELKLIEQMGFTTSRELYPLLNKEIRSIIANLNRLKKHKDIEIFELGRCRLYVSRKILDIKFSIKR